MIGTHLATVGAPPTGADSDLVERLAAAVAAKVHECLINPELIHPELVSYTPKQAALIFGKTENWVIEAIQARRIPCTYVGRTPRLTAVHIRWVLDNGEVKPHEYATRTAA